jgi:hypothetical protein
MRNHQLLELVGVVCLVIGCSSESPTATGTGTPSNAGGSGGADAGAPMDAAAGTGGVNGTDGGIADSGGTVTPPPNGTTCAWARGWASGALGGRGGQIVRVTTLAATGSGSLAEALSLSGPRVIVFEVGGLIDLDRTTLEISEPYVTIAGQTAPSPGVTLIEGGLRIVTHDVVIEHLRVRPGEAGQPKGSGWEPDGVATWTGAYNVVVDHCSVTWGVDENLSASGDRFLGDGPDAWRAATTHQVTFSHNIIAEGLSDSTHGDGEHSKGSLIHDNVTGALIYANLYASNVERNPFFKGGARGVVANNLIVNPRQYAMKYTLVESEWGDHPYERGQMAVVGNVFEHGPDTGEGVPLVFSSGVGECDIHLADNVAEDEDGNDVELMGGEEANFVEQATPPLWPEGFEALPSGEVRTYVEQNVGARPWDRDEIDARILAEALAGTSSIIDSEQDVGGYPVHAETRAPFDPAQWDLSCMVRKSDDAP